MSLQARLSGDAEGALAVVVTLALSSFRLVLAPPLLASGVRCCLQPLLLQSLLMSPGTIMEDLRHLRPVFGHYDPTCSPGNTHLGPTRLACGPSHVDAAWVLTRSVRHRLCPLDFLSVERCQSSGYRWGCATHNTDPPRRSSSHS